MEKQPKPKLQIGQIFCFLEMHNKDALSMLLYKSFPDASKLFLYSSDGFHHLVVLPILEHQRANRR